jgi:hypothetical protein
MARRPTGKPAGHPLIYQDDEDRPVSISVRIPRTLYDQLDRFVYDHRTTQSAVLLDALRRVLPRPAPPAPVPVVVPPPLPQGVPPYDVKRFMIGSLCRRQHDYTGKGESLRRLVGGSCVECARENQRKGP